VPDPAVGDARLFTDEALVEQICKGDPGPFDLLYQRYFARVYRFVDKRVSNRADVEETVQEVFFNLFSSLSSFRGEAPFAAWVFGLTRRTIAARYKRKRAETVPLPTDEEESAGRLALSHQRHPDPHEAYECQEWLRQLDRTAREDLSEQQWQLFRLHHLEHRSIQEIATTLATTEDAVKSHLYRARRLLLTR
jgi:RNA polymerase sigma-70 factor (ECF subfamily)